jgi:hypothetical protein
MGGEGGQGGAPHELDCTNGTDDDGDDLADCDDPDCGAYQCVPAAADGSTYAFPVGTADVCPAPTAAVTLDECGDAACSCTATPGTCYEWAYVYSGDTCSSYLDTKYDGCYDPYDGNRSFSGGVQPWTTGTCTAPGAQVPPTGWRGCTTTTTGHCASGGACVPRIATATDQCVLVSGSVSCAAPYTESRTLYDEALTQCSCSCAWQSETCPAGSATVFHENDSCGGGSTTEVPLDGQCHAGGMAWSYQLELVKTNLTCSRLVAPLEIVNTSTLCCLP